MLRTVFEQPDAASVRAQHRHVVQALDDSYPKAAEHLDEAREDILAFAQLSTRAGLIRRAVGIFAAAAFIVGSSPWLTPHWWNSLVAILVAAWGVLLALSTATRTEHPGDAPERMSTTV
jgi:hypothetical protein